MKILAILGGNGQCEQVRVKLPLFHLKGMGHTCHWVQGASMAGQMVKTHQYDIVVLPRFRTGMKEIFDLAVNEFHEVGTKVVYETDDDYEDKNPTDPLRGLISDETIDDMFYVMSKCDAVTTTTPYLAQKIGRHVPGRKVYVLPNSIDFDIWDAVSEKHRVIDGLTVGWYGGASHADDFQIIEDVLTGFQDKFMHVKFVLCGYSTYLIEQALGERLHRFQWVELPQFPALVKQIDIGMAPILDTEFNRCKSNLKWLEYSALGIPTVASPVGPYKNLLHGVNVLHAQTQGEWAKHLRTLITDKNARQRIGLRAQRDVRATYDIKSTVKLWEAAYREISGKE